MASYADPLLSYTYPYMYANPPRYLLSSLEPQRLLMENESLRKRNLALESTLHSLPSHADTPTPDLQTEIASLRLLAQSRLEEVEYWKRRAMGVDEGRVGMGDIEGRVMERVERVVGDRMRVVRAENDRLIGENRELRVRVGELNRDIDRGKREGWDRSIGMGADWQRMLDEGVREAERRERSIADEKIRYKEIELADVKAQLEYVKRALLERDDDLRRQKEDIGKKYVGDEGRLKSEVENLRRNQDRLAADLTLNNIGLNQRMRDLETTNDYRPKLNSSIPLTRLPGTTLNSEYQNSNPANPRDIDLAIFRLTNKLFK